MFVLITIGFQVGFAQRVIGLGLIIFSYLGCVLDKGFQCRISLIVRIFILNESVSMFGRQSMRLINFLVKYKLGIWRHNMTSSIPT